MDSESLSKLLLVVAHMLVRIFVMQYNQCRVLKIVAIIVVVGVVVDVVVG